MKKRLISILLALTLSFSFFIVSGLQAACSAVSPSISTSDTTLPTEPTEPAGDDVANVPENVQKVNYTSGTHIYTAPVVSDKFIVKDGRTDYKIIVPYVKTIGTYTKQAASEMVLFFKQATGITLNVIYESQEGGYTHNSTDKYFSIGHTELLKSSGIDYNSAELQSLLEYGGCRVVTKDNIIYMFGGMDEGSAYAVYDFLNIAFNYEYYAPDCWEIDEGVRDLNLRNFDVTDVPDAALRDCYWGYISANSEASLRMRSVKGSWIMPAGDAEKGQSRKGFHNTAAILPKGYGDSKWQSDEGTQLCYTAHGDPESYDAMTSQVAKVLEQSLKEYPTAKYPDYHLITVTIEDTGGKCNCSACSKAYEKYGEPAGQLIVFCNDVMEKITEWWDKPENAAYKRDNFYLMFFAYAAFVMCPATYDPAQGKYIINDPDLEMREDTGVFFAANNVNYFLSIYDEGNNTARENARAWFDIAPATYLWLYEVSFGNYLTMWDTYDHFNSEGFQFWQSGEPLVFLNQAAYDSYDVTSFQGLKVYLDSKLQWDCTLDSNELTDKWFNAMFGQAASVMRQLFDDERVYTNVLHEQLGLRQAFNFMSHAASQKNWSLMALNKWLDYIETARLINDTFYKEGMPDVWEMINHHIDQEFCFPGYMMLNLYDTEVAGPIYDEVVNYFKANNDIFSGYYFNQDSDSQIAKTWNNYLN